jgi:hypothetical protein
MQTLYFVLMVFGVGWLMVWIALPDHVAARFRAPFDMREDAPAPDAGAPQGDAPTPGSGWRARAARRLARGAPVARRRRGGPATPPRHGAGV